MDNTNTTERLEELEVVNPDTGETEIQVVKKRVQIPDGFRQKPAEGESYN